MIRALENHIIKSLQSAFSYDIEISLIELFDQRVDEYFPIAEKKFSDVSRQRAWSAGRVALADVLRKAGLEENPHSIVFPHPKLSLTHSKEMAVAVCLRGEPSNVLGIGIDLEGVRNLRSRTDKFFLDEEEKKLLGDGDLILAWSIKEACFKADVENAGEVLNNYKIKAVDVGRGSVKKVGSQGEEIEFVYGSTDDLRYAVALRIRD